MCLGGGRHSKAVARGCASGAGPAECALKVEQRGGEVRFGSCAPDTQSRRAAKGSGKSCARSPGGEGGGGGTVGGCRAGESALARAAREAEEA